MREVGLIVDREGWRIVGTVDGRTKLLYEPYRGQWTIGPVEVARILERLGVKVTLTVERTI